MGYPALANNNPANMSQDDSVAVQLPSGDAEIPVWPT